MPSRAFHNFTLAAGRGHAVKQQRVAEQNAECRYGIDEQTAQRILIAENAAALLPKTEKLGP